MLCVSTGLLSTIIAGQPRTSRDAAPLTRTRMLSHNSISISVVLQAIAGKAKRWEECWLVSSGLESLAIHLVRKRRLRSGASS